MSRSRSPDSIEAEKLYQSGMSLVDIARKLGKPEGTVRRWKSTQKWDDGNKNERSETKTNARVNKTNTKEAIAEDVRQVISNPDLTDKQRLFCLKYVRCFNATKAYQKAYGVSYAVANAEGYKLLVNPRVKAEIQRLKQNRLNREMLDESDIFQKYMDIAFADITDFVEFGREEIPVMTMYGPLEIKDDETGEKIKVTKEVNTVRFKEYEEVDGTLITEVKQGRDGASLKLADRMKALEWLDAHMGLATEEQKARIEQMKAKTESIRRESTPGDDEGVEIINDAAQEAGPDIGVSDTEVSADIQ